MKFWPALAGSLLVFAVLAYGLMDTAPWGDDPAGGHEDMETLAESLFDTNVVALEVLGVLLTGAMIGAMIIARPLGNVADEPLLYSEEEE